MCDWAARNYAVNLVFHTMGDGITPSAWSGGTSKPEKPTQDAPARRLRALESLLITFHAKPACLALVPNVSFPEHGLSSLYDASLP